ncbi:MAG: ATP-binding cassette domain-containing protein, partial [Lachnospiraceae bacterium]
MSMLKVTDMQVYYGVIQAIKGISFEVEEGEVIALIGANGAGKTTLMRMICGVLKPTSGEVKFNGIDVSEESY